MQIIQGDFIVLYGLYSFQWFLVRQLHNHHCSSLGGLLCISVLEYIFIYICFRGGHNTVSPLSAVNNILSTTTPDRHAGY